MKEPRIAVVGMETEAKNSLLQILQVRSPKEQGTTLAATRRPSVQLRVCEREVLNSVRKCIIQDLSAHEIHRKYVLEFLQETDIVWAVFSYGSTDSFRDCKHWVKVAKFKARNPKIFVVGLTCPEYQVVSRQAVKQFCNRESCELKVWKGSSRGANQLLKISLQAIAEEGVMPRQNYCEVF